MIHILTMLLAAAAMAVLREPLGRGLANLVQAIGRRHFATFAVALFLLWDAAHYFHAGIAAPISSDALAFMFDLFAYPEVVIGIAVALLSQQARAMIRRVRDPVVRAGLVVARRVGRARRPQPAAKPRRAPPEDEPEPVLAFA